MDDIASKVASQTQMPVCIIMALDYGTGMQCIVGAHGTALKETRLEDSACQRVIKRDLPVIISNALDHPNFCKSLPVVDTREFRFYAGAPLIFGPGVRPGAIAVLDFEPRDDFSLEKARPLQPSWLIY